MVRTDNEKEKEGVPHHGHKGGENTCDICYRDCRKRTGN